MLKWFKRHEIIYTQLMLEVENMEKSSENLER
jgi:hypothetical protein